ncbi:hypothetical protein [Serratia ficaria]|uniref:hypothetical protein n=1 Tax=Serratia ficaria TaxID=61651 RepID=UPI00217B5EBE|nr:hypothetical protein [Serratia ficaria]CAI1507209.1 Uncharacterised protein [Serratia ficaria]
MKKIMLATLVALMSSQSFAATLTSQGTATTTMTLTAPAGWTITKGAVGEGTLGAGNKFTNDSILNQVPTLIIKNETATAGNYYLRGQGDSKANDGSVMFVKRGDTSKTFWAVDFAKHSGTTWVAADEAYKSKSPLAANGEATITLTALDGTTIEPGTYDVSVELLTETP